MPTTSTPADITEVLIWMDPAALAGLADDELRALAANLAGWSALAEYEQFRRQCERERAELDKAG